MYIKAVSDMMLRRLFVLLFYVSLERILYQHIQPVGVAG